MPSDPLQAMTEVSPASVARILGEHFAASCEVGNIKRTFPGISRETYIIDATIGCEPQSFALRLDPPNQAHTCPYPLRQEWEIYRHLWRTEVPVAEPLWYDEGGDFAGGRPYMMRRLVQGTTTINGLYDRDAVGERLRRTVAFECAEKLALLHRMDWEAAGFGTFLHAPASPADAFRQEFEEWAGRWREVCPYPNPVIDEAVAWLGENVPADTPRLSLVKGNNGVGEEIWRDGRIVALCDWELSSIADGALDLAFSQGTLSLYDFDAVLAHYVDCVGAEVSPQRLAFSHVFILLKHFVCGSYMYRLWREGKRPEPYMLSFGLGINSLTEQRLGRCIGRDIVSAFAEMVGKESSYYRSIGG